MRRGSGNFRIGHQYSIKAHGESWGHSVHWRLFSIEWSWTQTLRFFNLCLIGFFFQYIWFKEAAP